MDKLELKEKWIRIAFGTNARYAHVARANDGLSIHGFEPCERLIHIILVAPGKVGASNGALKDQVARD